jgi:hypothetical protein
MQFNYELKETCTRTRFFKITSEVKLIEDEAKLLASELVLNEPFGNTESCDFSDWEEENGLPPKGNYEITFTGSEYGDDSQTEFYEVNKND